MDITIAEMNLSHLNRVLEIERQSFSDPWSRRSFYREIKENRYALYLSAIYQKNVIGYIGGWIISDELHITNLAIDNNYRHRGIGQHLIEELLKCSLKRGVKRATLEVRVSNLPAIKLYEKKGFSAAGYRPKYYRNNNEDALIMWKELKCDNDKVGDED